MDSNNQEKKDLSFVKEVIIEKPNRRKKYFLVFTATVVLAVVFGVISGTASYFTNNKLESNAQISEDDNELIVNTTKQLVMNTIDDLFVEYIKNANLKIETYDTLINTYISNINKNIYLVHSYSVKMNDNNVEEITDETVQPAVVFSIDDDVLLLTDYSGIKNRKKIYVELEENSFCTAVLQRSDEELGLCVLLIEQDSITRSVKEGLNVTDISRDVTNQIGELVIYAGISENSVKAIETGYIIANEKTIQYTDAEYSLIEAGMVSNGLGFIYNTDYKLIGITRPKDKANGNGTVTAMAVNDVFVRLYAMLYGSKYTYIGLQGSNVTPSLRIIANNPDMPSGIYVKSVDRSSPAYNAGVMSGDIITAVDGNEVKTFKELNIVLLQRRNLDKITVTIKRMTASGYLETDLAVNLSKK